MEKMVVWPINKLLLNKRKPGHNRTYTMENLTMIKNNFIGTLHAMLK